MNTDKHDYICINCDYVGPRKKVKRGSAKLEMFIWVVLTPIAPLYTLWRMFFRVDGCPRCSNQKMVMMRERISEEQLERELAPEKLAQIPDRWQKDREEYKQKQQAGIQPVPQKPATLDPNTVYKPKPRPYVPQRMPQKPITPQPTPQAEQTPQKPDEPKNDKPQDW